MGVGSLSWATQYVPIRRKWVTNLGLATLFARLGWVSLCIKATIGLGSYATIYIDKRQSTRAAEVESDFQKYPY